MSANDNSPAPAPPEPPRQIVRTFSRCGPCITEGQLIRTTARLFVYAEWKGGQIYEGEKRIMKSKAHIAPCHSCRDHERTSYPHGYMD